MNLPECPQISKDAIEQYLMISQIIDRGWTRAMITLFLGEPDQKKKNYYRMGEIKLYKIKRVLEKEQSQEFIERQEKTKERKLRGLNQAKIRQDQLINEINQMEIIIPKYSDDDVIKKAIIHYNDLWASRNSDKYATKNDNESFLKRITVNYLRHVCSIYEEKFEEVYRKTGAVEGRSLIRKRIYDEISKIYPQYKYECEKQYSERTI